MPDPTTAQIRDLSPPGEMLEEVLEERGMTNAELARRTGLSQKHLSQLINAHVPLSMDVALQLERVLGIPARLWNSMEFNYRAEQKRAEQRGSLTDFADWMRQFPIAAMRKAGYFGDAVVGQAVACRVEALLQFFGVATPDAWEAEWAHATQDITGTVIRYDGSLNVILDDEPDPDLEPGGGEGCTLVYADDELILDAGGLPWGALKARKRAASDARCALKALGILPIIAEWYGDDLEADDDQLTALHDQAAEILGDLAAELGLAKEKK